MGTKDPPGGKSSHLHGDIHAVYFDPRDPAGQTLYVATDGGVAVTRNLGLSWNSSINSHLLDHQFQSSPTRYSAWGGWSGASLVTPGLVAGALQDNGVVYAGSGSNPNCWQRIGKEEDGLLALMLPTDTLLWCTDSDQSVRAAQWNGNSFGKSEIVGVKTPKPNVPAISSIPLPFVEPIFHPAAWRRPGLNQRMFAVAVYSPSGPTSDVWGYFSDDDGTKGAWHYLTTMVLDPADVGDDLSNIGCDDGVTAYIGTHAGKIYLLDIPSTVFTYPGLQSKMSIGPGDWPSDPVQQFSSLPGGLAFARYPNNILRLANSRWESIPTNSGLPVDEGNFYAMAVDRLSRDIFFVATDFGVYATPDLGNHWVSVSQGLPRRAHPSTLRSVQYVAGHYLYLTTYGRSAYLSPLTPLP